MRERPTRSWATSLVVLTLALLSLSRDAHAGGYDTPVVYSARHVGMGGAAIGYVSDASAVVHNPAGLHGIEGLGLLADFSLLLATLRASPDVGDGVSGIESETALAPFFLAGAGYRVHPWLTFALAAYPLASGGASYRYANVAGVPTEDRTRLVFMELSPAASVNLPADALLPGQLSFGVGYRVDLLQFERQKGPPGDPVVIDLDLSGVSATGLRFGVAWQPDRSWSFGLVYRTAVSVRAEGDSGTAVNQTIVDPHADFTLPARLGAGARLDLNRLSFALDLEQGFHSDNDVAPLRGEIGGVDGTVNNVFAWRDAQTAHVGAEYRLGAEQQLPLRLGYVFDGEVSNARFPSAFGTPPTATHSVTVGAGHHFERFQIHAAYAYRFGDTEVQSAELAPASECRFCSQAGDYGLRMHGFYLDVSCELDL